MTENAAEPVAAAGPPISADAEIVARARAHDEGAYAAIIRRHNQRLFRIARSILKDDAEAEDAVQDAYIQVFRNLDSLREDANLGAWLGRITVNEALTRLRRRRPTIGLEAVDEAMETRDSGMTADPLGTIQPQDPEAMAARSEIKTVLEHAIDRLPTHFRMVFVACAIEQMSIEEAASCLALPRNTVKTRFHRAKRRLREMLGADILSALPESYAFRGKDCDRMTARVLARLADER